MSQLGETIVVAPVKGREIGQGIPRGPVSPRNQDFKKLTILKRQTQILINSQPNSQKCKGGQSLLLTILEKLIGF